MNEMTATRNEWRRILILIGIVLAFFGLVSLTLHLIKPWLKPQAVFSRRFAAGTAKTLAVLGRGKRRFYFCMIENYRFFLDAQPRAVDAEFEKAAKQLQKPPPKRPPKREKK
jgi:hypothetical protein